MRHRIELLNMDQTAWFWPPVALLFICHIIFSYSPCVFSITFIESHYSLRTTGLSLLLSTSSKPSLPTCRSDMKPSDVDDASLVFPPLNKWMCVCVRVCWLCRHPGLRSPTCDGVHPRRLLHGGHWEHDGRQRARQLWKCCGCHAQLQDRNIRWRQFLR